MATFNEFVRQHIADDAKVRRLYWVHGEEEIFRLQTVALVRKVAGADPFNTLRLNAAEDSESEIWASLNQHPLDSEHKRLIVVHDAQVLTELERLIAWLKDTQITRSRTAVAVFVSSDAEFEHPAREDIVKASSAMIVKCSLPKNEDDRLKRAVEIVQAWGNIDSTTAAVLVKRVNFDMHEAYAVMRKAALFPDAKITVQAVEALASRRVEEDVLWSLIALNKKAAVEAVTEGVNISVSQMIGSLGTALETLSRMNAALSSSSSGVRDMAKRVGANEQYVRMLFPYARLYPAKESVRRTLLLNRIDNAYQRGADHGLLEALIALW